MPYRSEILTHRKKESPPVGIYTGAKGESSFFRAGVGSDSPLLI